MLTDLLTPLLERANAIRQLGARMPMLYAAAIIGITAVMIHAGYGLWAMALGGIMALTEAWTRRSRRHLNPTQNTVTIAMLRHSWALAILTTTAFALPGILLMGHPSEAIMLSGMMWLFGVQANVAATYARFPVFSLPMSAPLVLAMFAGLGRAAQVPHVSSPAVDWAITAVLIALYIVASAQGARRQAEADRALGDARREADERMRRLEDLHRRDSLTGLLNRRAFDAALAKLLLGRQRSVAEIAVFMIDLDSFKPINDTYSHQAGDQVLIITARRLRQALGDRGIIGRLGGDEFICAVPGMAAQQAPEQLGAQLMEVISRPITWQGRELRIHGSVGIAVTHLCESPTVSALCSAADQAMFRAKSSPSPHPVLYDPQSFAPAMSQRDRQCLVDALNDGQIRPYYQPKVYLPTGEILGFEALARWQHPDGDVLTPAAFLDQINEMGLQGHFLNRMTRAVTSDITAMMARGLDPGQVSINVPEVALATHTGQHEMARIVAQHPHLRGHLTFEITEDVFIARAAEAIQASIATFRNLGVRISLDDFGTGFASFHHLRQLDFDELKIDTSFVSSLGSDPTSEVLVQGFLSIASGLGVSVIAEGVETEDQRRDLLNLGCIAAQGFLFSPAVPFAEAADMLARATVSPARPARVAGAPPLAGPDAPDAP